LTRKLTVTADNKPRLRTIQKSSKLDNVCYDIRGPVMARARQMEEEGHRIIKLNIGNPAPFGFEAPEEIVQDVIVNLPNASGYSDSKGLFAARKAIMHETQRKGIPGVQIDDIFVGNGVSELIVMSMQALLNNGDEVLVPAPDYPLWTAAVSLGGGKPRHYLCDEGAGWLPDLDDIRAKITHSTRAIVIINPNNPTGALYPTELLLEILAPLRRPWQPAPAEAFPHGPQQLHSPVDLVLRGGRRLQDEEIQQERLVRQRTDAANLLFNRRRG
jgi:alanine-synthesizing transaminase